jgi:hypothetical protein
MGTDTCTAGGTRSGVVPLTMEWAGVVLRHFEIGTYSGSGVPVDAIGVTTSSSRNGTDLDVEVACTLTDGTGLAMGCGAEWMSVATGPGYAWGFAEEDSVDFADLYDGTTHPDALWSLVGTTCGQAGWSLDFHGGPARLAGLASGYADCSPDTKTTTQNLWTTWLGDTAGTTATSTFHGRHQGTALFSY